MKKQSSIILLLLLLYCIFGTLGAIFFRQGGVYEDYYWLFFIVGNLFGWSSTWLLMLLYARFKSANVANLVSIASSTIFGQVVMWLLFHSPFNWQMLTGLCVMLAGMLIAVSNSSTTDKKEVAK